MNVMASLIELGLFDLAETEIRDYVDTTLRRIKATARLGGR